MTKWEYSRKFFLFDDLFDAELGRMGRAGFELCGMVESIVQGQHGFMCVFKRQTE